MFRVSAFGSQWTGLEDRRGRSHKSQGETVLLLRGSDLVLFYGFYGVVSGFRVCFVVRGMKFSRQSTPTLMKCSYLAQPVLSCGRLQVVRTINEYDEQTANYRP